MTLFLRNIVLLVVLMAEQLNAQQNWYFQHFPTEAGQAFFEVFGVCRDKYGKVWFYGNGVAGWFDGYRYTPIFHSDGRQTGLPDPLISSMYQDHKGALWAEGPGYLAVFNHQSGQFEVNVRLDGKRIRPFVLFEQKNSKYQKTPPEKGTNDLVAIKNKDRGTYTFQQLDPEIGKTAPLRFIFPGGKLFENRMDGWWELHPSGKSFFSSEGKMYEAQRIGENEFRIVSAESQFACEGIPISFILHQDTRGVLWALTADGRLATKPLDERRFELFTDIPDLQLSAESDIKPFINGDREGRIWIINRGKIYIYSPDTHQYEVLTPRTCGSDGLLGKGFYSVFHDSAGVHWVSGVEGVTIITEISLPVSCWRNPADSVEERTYAVLEAADGTVWAGVRNSGLYHLSPNLQVLEFFPLNDEGAGARVGSGPTALTQDATGDIWVGTYGMGLYRLDSKRRKLIRLPVQPNNPAALPVKDAFRTTITDRKGNIWFARCNGISIWQPSLQRFYNLNLPGRKDTDPCSHIYALLEDADGRIWIGEGGPTFYRLDPNTGIFEPYSLPFGHTYVLSFLADHINGDLWIGTGHEGLLRYSPSKKQVLAQYDTRSGLPCNEITAVLDDPQGNLWLATCDGISKFDPKRIAIENYGKAEGLPCSEFMSDAFFKSNASGKMYFGSKDGLLAFDPRRLEKSSGPCFVPLLSITACETGGIGKCPVPGSDLVLRPGENNLKLYFASLDFRFPNQKKYSFFLENLDRTWGDTLPESVASYTHLRPGNYVFHLRGTDSRGNWIRAEYTLRIQVSPFWWQSAWFRSLVALGSAALLGGLGWYLLQRRDAALRKDAQAALLTARRYQMLPHFVFNSLNAANEYLTEDNIEGANKFIASFAELMHLHLGDLGQDFIPLSQECRFLELYLEVQHRRYRDKFDYCFEVSDALLACNPAIPPMLVQPFVENAIQHGLRPLGTKGLLIIRFFQQGEEMVCTVEDNGVGRAGASLAGNPTEGHHHLGLESVRTRIVLLNQLYRTHMAFEIEDLAPVAGSPGGTKVVLRMKLREYHPNISS